MSELTNNTEQRLSELSEASERSSYFTFTDFLGLAEQSDLEKILAKRHTKHVKFGGAEGAERIMVRFGDEDELGYSEPFPIVTLKIVPKSEKYCENLTHRDYLGSILALGIRREVIGDIIVSGKTAYVFVRDSIAEYIVTSLTKVRHTDVITAEISSDELPSGELYKTEQMIIQLSGERIDAAIAKVFHLSRDEAQTLIKRGLVFISGKECVSVSTTPKESDVISVRGHGRFIYSGAVGTSKKGKLNVKVLLYV